MWTASKLQNQRQSLLLGVIIALSLINGGCSGRYVEIPMLKGDVLLLQIRADNNVNSYESKSHSIVVVVYFLDDLEILRKMQLAKMTFSDVEKTLRKKKYVKNVGRHHLMASEKASLKVVIDSAYKYVFIAAGFYMQKDFNQYTRTYLLKNYVPIFPFKWFRKKLVQAVSIELGADNIVTE